MTSHIDWRNTLPKIVACIIVVPALLVPLFTNNPASLSIVILSGIWAVVAMGFTLILWTGQFSLGQSAFMAIGGYTSAILTAHLDWPFWPSFLAAGLVSGIVACAVGAVVLRVGGFYFSIITLALGEIVRIIAMQWQSVTRGTRGLVTYPPETISLGFINIDFTASTVPWYYFMIVLVAFSGLIYWRIGKSRIGGTFFSVAANPMLAEHQGIHLMKYRVIAFTVAGVFTGLAGSFYGHFLSAMTPYTLGIQESIQVMIMSIVGGISSLVAGPIVGSVVLYNLSQFLQRLNLEGIHPVVFGGAIVCILLFLPKGTGLVDLWTKFWKRVYGEVDFYELPEDMEKDIEVH
ncbi:MAG: branched-chain amino acid ABC transporter permease [Syntrophobacteraceae bacterium]|jgi:branched-chain amino acid transport system permease protein